MSRYRLLTNLRYVSIIPPECDQATARTPVRAHAFALLLSSPQGPSGYEHEFPIEHPTVQVRGFLTHEGLEVFDMVLATESMDYEVGDWQGRAFILRDDDSLSPVASGHTLRFEDGTALALWAEDPERPLKVDDLDEITDVWAILQRRVAEHWTAPAMPFPVWQPPAVAATMANRWEG